LADISKQNSALRNAGDLSEVLILTVVDNLGAATIPEIVRSLEIATKNGKMPFVVGTSVGQVLQWRGERQEVTEETRGRYVVYRTTPRGKKLVQDCRQDVLRFFPRVLKIRNALHTL
jgi:hypothetical protein